jgi:hypothetical protein
VPAPTVPSVADEQSLPILLWRVLGGLEQAHRDHGAGAGALPSLEVWSNLLRRLDAEGVPSRDLPGLLCLSKRALRSHLSLAQRRGWVEEVSLAAKRPGVRLTDAGEAVRRRWPKVRQAAEQTWADGAGAGPADGLRPALVDLVGGLALEHPHYPASYGAADARVSGGHGQDWKPVPRGAGDTASDLPLSALVSEALMDFALEYEERADVALSVALLALTHIPDRGRPARGLGIPAGWLSALVRHGVLHADQRPEGVWLTLTADGERLAGAHEHHVRAVEEFWRQRYGAKVVDGVRSALASVGRAPHVRAAG